MWSIFDILNLVKIIFTYSCVRSKFLNVDLGTILCRTVPLYVQGMLNLDLYKIFFVSYCSYVRTIYVGFFVRKIRKTQQKGGEISTHHHRKFSLSLGTKQEVTKTSSSFYSLIVLRIPPPIDTILAEILQRK